MYEMPIIRAVEVAVETNILRKPIVVFPSDDLASTDGDAIYVNIPKIRDIIRRSLKNKNRRVVRRILHEVLNYIVAHETMHIVLSDIQLFRRYSEHLEALFGSLAERVFRIIANLLEDMRIEYLMQVYFPALIEPFREGREILYSRALKKPIKIRATRNLNTVLGVIRLIHRIALSKNPLDGINRYKKETDPSTFRGTMSILEDYIPIIFACRISKNKSIAYRTAAQIVGDLHQTIKEIEKHWYLTKKYLYSIAKRSLRQYIKEKYPSKTQALITQGKTRISGAYSKLTPAISKADYRYYKTTIIQNKDRIQQLREKLLRILRIWKEKRHHRGDLLEDHLVDIYVWSYTHDEPRPKAFSYLSEIFLPLDILLLIDQSGSMLGLGENLAATSAVIIAEALRPLIENGFLRLGIAGFGDYLIYYKRVPWPMAIARVIPRSSGGTIIFSAINRFFRTEKKYLRRDARLLIMVFTDSEDYPEDLEIASSVRDTLRKFNPRSHIVAYITEREYNKSFIARVDGYYTIDSIESLPEAVTNTILEFVHGKKIYRPI